MTVAENIWIEGFFVDHGEMRRKTEAERFCRLSPSPLPDALKIVFQLETAERPSVSGAS